jgi:DNA repair exonuclease SbcCD ATPase subunit
MISLSKDINTITDINTTDIEELRALAKTLIHQIAILSQQLGIAASEVEHFKERELELLRQANTIAEQKDQIQKLKEENARLNGIITTHEDRIKVHEDRIKGLEEGNKELQEGNKVHEDRIKGLEEGTKELQEGNKKLQAEIQSLKQPLQAREYAIQVEIPCMKYIFAGACSRPYYIKSLKNLRTFLESPKEGKRLAICGDSASAAWEKLTEEDRRKVQERAESLFSTYEDLGDSIGYLKNFACKTAHPDLSVDEMVTYFQGKLDEGAKEVDYGEVVYSLRLCQSVDLSKLLQ